MHARTIDFLWASATMLRLRIRLAYALKKSVDSEASYLEEGREALGIGSQHGCRGSSAGIRRGLHAVGAHRPDEDAILRAGAGVRALRHQQREARRPHHHPELRCRATPVDIARDLFRELHSVTEMLVRMEKDGLVTSTKAPAGPRSRSA